jgi:hypothetical protein
MADDKDEHR